VRTTFLPTGGGPDGRSPVLIRRGASVAYSVYSLHRRTDLYGEDAEHFRPERWGEDLGLFRDETTAKWGYLPFNGGPRICLGGEFFVYDLGLALLLFCGCHYGILTSADSGLCTYGGCICRGEDFAEISDCQDAARSDAREAGVGTTDCDHCPFCGRWM